MNIIVLLAIGSLLGWIIGRIFGLTDGLVSSAGFGAVGAVAGGLLAGLIIKAGPLLLGLTRVSLIGACLGALLLIGLRLTTELR